MPILNIDRIVSFSSEDKVHIANNILGNNTALRWKCKSSGEKHATLVLQLEKACVITGIDIGNEHSAYIEVLASRSGDDADFKTLLPMSSFMSAIESRQSTNMNRVRMFKKDDLSKPECEEKWDRIRVVCTQPFNKHVQYGLSFIKFHTNEIRSNDSANESLETIGGFRLRPNSPVDFKPGYLFAKRKELTDEKPSSVAAAIRASNSSLLNGTASPPARSSRLLPELLRNSEKRKKKNDINPIDVTLKPRHRDELFYSEEDDKPNAKIDKLIENRDALKKNKREDEEKALRETNKPEKKDHEETIMEKVKTSRRSKDNQHAQEGTSSSKKRESNKRKLPEKNETSPKKMKCSKITKPFERLLEDVVLVISGIQNPDRANLRGKVLEMGAKYKPDWDNTSTHLVCAYMNTPKFNQVRGKGKIVTRQWVEECYNQRKKIPWRRFALDKNESNNIESEDEVSEQIEDYKLITPQKNNSSIVIDSDTMELASDTEETIERIQNSNLMKSDNEENPTEDSTTRNSPISSVSDSTIDPYSVETDTDEETRTRKEQIKNKPFDFFKNLTFYIDNNFEDYILDMLKNYIFIHEGTLLDDPREDVIYIICGKEEAPNFKEVNLNALCILPDWIVDCHKCRQFIPPDEYFVL